jgi:CPA2 family monovalent cation:H+ antiporter-2
MLLAESPFATQVRADVSALRTLLMTLFFGSIGMFGDPVVLAREAGPIVVAVAGVVAAKIGLVFVSLRFFGAPSRAALGAGFCLAQIGEFSFVVAGMARADLLGDRLFQLVVSTTIATLFATPFLTRAAPALVRRAAPGAGEPPPDGPAAAGAVLVVGFGPTGRAVAAALHARGDAVHVVDLNPDLVAAAQKAGYHAHVGDAAHPEVLEHVGVARAVAVAVAVPDPGAARAVTEQVRALAPCARVFVRARYSRELRVLKQAGAHVVVDEEEQVGRALAAALTDELTRLGAKPSDAR